MIEMILRIGFSLLVVLLMMWGLARVARRPLARRGAAGGLPNLQADFFGAGESDKVDFRMRDEM